MIENFEHAQWCVLRLMLWLSGEICCRNLINSFKNQCWILKFLNKNVSVWQHFSALCTFLYDLSISLNGWRIMSPKTVMSKKNVLTKRKQNKFLKFVYLSEDQNKTMEWNSFAHLLQSMYVCYKEYLKFSQIVNELFNNGQFLICIPPPN